MDSDPLAHRLVNTMITVAQSLGLDVVAEGVETDSQRLMLLAAGCTVMQGFLFARPQPAAQLESMLRAASTPPGRAPLQIEQASSDVSALAGALESF